MYTIYRNNDKTTLACMPFYNMPSGYVGYFAEKLSKFRNVEDITKPYVFHIIDEDDQWVIPGQEPVHENICISTSDDEYYFELSSTPRSSGSETSQIDDESDDSLSTLSDDCDKTQEMDLSSLSTDFIHDETTEIEQEQEASTSNLNSSVKMGCPSLPTSFVGNETREVEKEPEACTSDLNSSGEMVFSLLSSDIIGDETTEIEKVQEDTISELNSSTTLIYDSVFDITQETEFSFDSTEHTEADIIGVETTVTEKEQEVTISELNSSATLSDDSVFDITQEVEFSFESTAEHTDADTTTVLSDEVARETACLENEVLTTQTKTSDNYSEKPKKPSRFKRCCNYLKRMNIFTGAVCSRIVLSLVNNYVII